jgi:putative transposase
VLCDGKGGLLAAVVAGANVHDAKLLEATIDAMFLQRPEPDEVTQHLCLDKGYDNPSGRRAALEADYVPHIRRIGEERLDGRGRRRHPARRWVVERALAWLNQCRAILVRFAKKDSNYLGMITLAVALLWYRRAASIGD